MSKCVHNLLQELFRFIIKCGKISIVKSLYNVPLWKVTPLHAAMVGGNDDLVKLLIEHGADVNAENKEGKKPIHYAAEEDNAEIILTITKGGK